MFRYAAKVSQIKYGICIIAASGVAWVTNPDENPDAKITKNLEILFNLFKEINLFYVDPVNPDSLLRSAAWGMSRHLDYLFHAGRIVIERRHCWTDYCAGIAQFVQVSQMNRVERSLARDYD